MKRQSSRMLAVIGLLLAAPSAYGQVTVQNSTQLTKQGLAEQSGLPVVRDAFGRPCLDVEAIARPHAANRDVIDHVVSVKNNCPKTIKVKVCYLKSDSCNALDLQAYKRIDTVLGTMMRVKTFQYSISQK